MARSGTPSARAATGQTLQPSRPQTNQPAAGGVPERAVPLVAYGLRKTSRGYETIKISVCGDQVEVLVLGQPEPQRAIAYEYLAQHVEQAYFHEEG